MLLQHNHEYKAEELKSIICDYLKRQLPDIKKLLPNFTIDKYVIGERARKIFEKDRKLFIDVGYAFYKYIAPIDGDSAHQLQQEANSDTPSDDLEAEQTYGNGEYTVYAWSLPMYRKHPNSEGYYSIKIGMTGKRPEERFQAFKSDLPESPVLLIAFRCSNDTKARELEKFFHKAFTTWKTDNTPGQEWFLTNPERIVEAYERLYLKTNAPNS